MQSSPDGLSILIPVYNYNVVELVNELRIQADYFQIPLEIIVAEDGSQEFYQKQNELISQLPSVTYLKLAKNIGRSAIRNLLASTATMDHIIFLDCDSKLVMPRFINEYFLNKNHPVVVGGRIYQDPPPEDKAYLLHWTVGTKREPNTVGERRKAGYRSFMFNNLMIERTLFLSISLDEAITTYGHEDTRFGEELEKSGIPVFHIDNAVLHAGLDDTESFLRKTIEGVRNLKILAEKGFGLQTGLVKTARKLEKFNLVFFYKKVYQLVLKKRVEKNLRSSTPSLINFDLYKLYYFLS